MTREDVDRSKWFGLLFVVVCTLTSVLPSAQAVPNEYTTILRPGQSFAERIQAAEGDLVVVVWVTDGPARFWITDPIGDDYRDQPITSGGGMTAVIADSPGTWVARWGNTYISDTDLILEYEVFVMNHESWN